MLTNLQRTMKLIGKIILNTIKGNIIEQVFWGRVPIRHYCFIFYISFNCYILLDCTRVSYLGLGLISITSIFRIRDFNEIKKIYQSHY